MVHTAGGRGERKCRLQIWSVCYARLANRNGRCFFATATCLGSADKNLDHLGLVIARDAASRTPSFKAVFAALQEDAHLAALDVDGHSSVFGVFDGHGGREVAKFVALYLVRLHSCICIVMTSAKVVSCMVYTYCQQLHSKCSLLHFQTINKCDAESNLHLHPFDMT